MEPPQPAKALEYLGVLTPEALAKSLPGESAALRTELASAAALLQAQALFKQGNDAAGVAQLKKLREDFKGSEAVVASYLEEADHYAKQFKIVEAQQLYQNLAEEFPGNDDGPSRPGIVMSARMRSGTSSKAIFSPTFPSAASWIW